MITAGIDAGSRAIKVVLYDSEKSVIIDKHLGNQSVKQDTAADKIYDQLLKRNDMNRNSVKSVVATGYARTIQKITDHTVTEITCHARGVSHILPSTRTIIEIGGQDSKLICLDSGGHVQDFCMNDRCAAGTGRFLEVVSDRLEVNLDELGELAAKSNNPASISSMCVVFAETEIIGLLASGTAPEDIVAGVMESIAARIVAMSGKNRHAPLVFTGGVALIPGMNNVLSNVIKKDVAVVPIPQYTGALGAALIAVDKC